MIFLKNSSKISRNVKDWYDILIYFFLLKVAVDNGIFNITFSIPGGMVTGIQYNEIDNLLENGNKDDNRG